MSDSAFEGYMKLLMLGAFAAGCWAAYQLDPLIKPWPRWLRWPAIFVITFVVLMAPAIVWTTGTYLRGR